MFLIRKYFSVTKDRILVSSPPLKNLLENVLKTVFLKSINIDGETRNFNYTSVCKRLKVTLLWNLSNLFFLQSVQNPGEREGIQIKLCFFRHHPASKDNDLKCIDTEIGEISEIELAALAMPSKLPA
jgi:hypothetical protein